MNQVRMYDRYTNPEISPKTGRLELANRKYEKYSTDVKTSSRTNLPPEAKNYLHNDKDTTRNMTPDEFEAYLREERRILEQGDANFEKLPPPTQEKLNGIDDKYAEMENTTREIVRNNLNPEVKKTISPARMITEGIAKILANVAADSLDELLALGDPISEILLDMATAFVTEKLTGRKLRSASNFISIPFSSFHGIEKNVNTVNKSGVRINRPFQKEVKGSFLRKPREKLAKMSYKAAQANWVADRKVISKVSKFRIGPLAIGNAIPVISALISPGAIDGFMDIVEGVKALMKGQKEIAVVAA